MDPELKTTPTASYVDATAVVDPGAQIGEGTKIWHYSHVLSGARIGARCTLGQNVMVARTARLGDGVKVQNNVSIYDGVELEDEVFCGPSVVFTNVVNPRAAISRKSDYKRTRVRRGATLGANSTIVCGVEIGPYAFIGAGAVVTRDVPAYSLVVGTPARAAGWVCSCGVKLAFTGDRAKCESCSKEFKAIGETKIEPMEKSRSVAKQAREPIPMVDLGAQHEAIGEQIEAAALGVLRSQRFILGPEVEAFEREVADYCGARFAIGVSSGSDALLVALMALGVGPGDEVVTTSYSFFATAGSVARLGAVPVFVDIERRSFNLDASKVEAAITKKTKAIVPVHLFGRCAQMSPILAMGDRLGIDVVEDAAQAIGAETGGQRAGTMGRVACFSCFPSKNLGAAGDAGFVTTNDADLAAKIRLLRAHGAQEKYIHRIVGGNFRLDEIQAAVLRVKLRHLDSWIEARRAAAARYDRLFAEAGLAPEKLRTPEPSESRHVYHQYVITTEKRDELARALAAADIASAVYYPLALHRQRCFAPESGEAAELPASEWTSAHALALPIYPELSAAQQERIVKTIGEFYQ